MNSSFGIIQMLNWRTKILTYPNFEGDYLKTLMLPNPDRVDLELLINVFNQVKDIPLQRLSNAYADETRRIIDHETANMLNVDKSITDQWRQWISQEPLISNKPYSFKENEEQNIRSFNFI